MSIQYIDAVLMVICLLFALGGFQKGFARQIAQLITFIISALGLYFVYPVLFELLRSSVSQVSDTYLAWLLIAVFVVIGLVVYIMTTRLVAVALKSQMSERSDRAMGMLLGMFRGVFIVTFFMVLTVILGPVKGYEVLHEKSEIGRLVCDEVVPVVQPHMTPANLRAKLQKAHKKLRNSKAGGFYDR